MKTSTASAASASTINSHMSVRRHRGAGRLPACVALLAILGTLAACGLPRRSQAPAAGETPSATAPAPTTPRFASGVVNTSRGRWVATDWGTLPGWQEDAVIHFWPSLLRSCEKPLTQWVAFCQAARGMANPDEAGVRAFLRQKLQPWRVETFEGKDEGLMTGYFEPLIEASRRRTAKFTVPLYGPPPDLETRMPWYTRAQIDTLPAAREALRGREIVWLQNPLDALLLQVQGSGRITLHEDGRTRLLRMAYAGHNGQPYQSVARWLVDQKAMTLEQASWPAIKQWARANPRRVAEMIHANPRYVFFREEALPDPTMGPLGAQGVPLTPGRSIAVDKDNIPYGTPVWIDTTEPQVWTVSGGKLVAPTAPPRPLRRLVMAQDTGAAITGAIRADYFWGWGQGADDLAGSMKQPLRMWTLWPNGQ